VRGPRRKPRALLVDFDGVLRVFDPAVDHAIEHKYGLSEGALWGTASRSAHLHLAVTGQITQAQWMDEVAGILGAPEAVAEWQLNRGHIDPVVLEVLAEVRAAGFQVALGTNATDRLDGDLAAFGIVDAFDAVVNASVVGVAKPHPDFYAAASKALDVPAAEILFLDDSPRFVAGARAAGLSAIRYTGHDDLRYVRTAFGL
jgi:putative hydrolase of the HAD superfamily